ncbi:aminoacyl-tRNA hydrolase [Candidatus Falkowbacteria bacterium]|nr:aminoacyl-tRNA hydrolase [Candidatus Falkowbacteria bacterium]
MKIIIGLGNPGEKYKNTRHNVGFMVLDCLQKKLANSFSDWRESKKFQAEISEGNLNDEKIILAKPLTFMNNSGQAAQLLLSFYKIESADLIVVHDDVDIAFGEFKIQTDRASAGHRGVQSIIDAISTQNFIRMRVGVGKSEKNKQGDTADFVLKNFSLFEKIKLNFVKEKIMGKLLQVISKPSKPIRNICSDL